MSKPSMADVQVDQEDIALLSEPGWHVWRGRNVWYVVRTVIREGKRVQERFHRTVLGDPPGMQVDHRDGNGLNNRRANLRVATCQQNAFNQRMKRSNSSGFPGVTRDRRDGAWVVQIRHAGGRWRKRFLNLEDATEACRKMALEFHGEFSAFHREAWTGKKRG